MAEKNICPETPDGIWLVDIDNGFLHSYSGTDDNLAVPGFKLFSLLPRAASRADSSAAFTKIFSEGFDLNLQQTW